MNFLSLNDLASNIYLFYVNRKPLGFIAGKIAIFIYAINRSEKKKKREIVFSQYFE